MSMFSFLLLLTALHQGPAGTPLPDVIPADALNCSLTVPPATSGEVMMHGELTNKVFPRRPEIPRRYTGCQVLWVALERGWVVLSVAYIKKGKGSVLWSPAEGDWQGLLCQYRKGHLSSGPQDDCPEPADLLIPSMPAGCAEKYLATEEDVPGCDDQ